MPIATHPEFVGPKDPNVKIWRYLDFTKYVDVLSNTALFFCSLAKLDDPFEGSWTRQNVVARPAKFQEHLGYLVEGEVRPTLDEMNKEWVDHAKMLRRRTAVNCWHVGQYESAAMWGLYVGDRNKGVALQSTYSRLAESLDRATEDIYIGCVKYLDFNTDTIPDFNRLASVTCKRRSYTYEAELRAVVVSRQTDEEGRPTPPAWEPEHGISVGVDLERLIEKVYVSPAAPDWFTNLVESVSKRYGLKAPVDQSSLSESPVY